MTAIRRYECFLTHYLDLGSWQGEVCKRVESGDMSTPGLSRI
jgi:hypothetical protein